MGYLDSNGLAHLWSKIRAVLSGKQDKLTGAAGHVVGFNTQGQAGAIPGFKITYEAETKTVKIGGAV